LNVVDVASFPHQNDVNDQELALGLCVSKMLDVLSIHMSCMVLIVVYHPKYIFNTLMPCSDSEDSGYRQVVLEHKHEQHRIPPGLVLSPRPHNLPILGLNKVPGCLEGEESGRNNGALLEYDARIAAALK